ncbi:kinase-like protein [Rickenella mellea]|uniref:Kinase-like protein n=1 Tax=Rickenella mellea TaxID=50990 RepID=A0A4Y7QFP3_9AGAM|nr:kinase-like protein [Rickenella mellea]
MTQGFQRRVKALLESCKDLKAAFESKALDREQVIPSLEKLQEIEEKLKKVPSYPRWKRFLLFYDVANALTEGDDECNRVFKSFVIMFGVESMSGLNEIKESQLKLGSDIVQIKEAVLMQKKEDFAELRQNLKDIKRDPRARWLIARNAVIGGQIRSCIEVEIAEYERLLNSMDLPEGIRWITEQVTTQYAVAYSTGLYCNIHRGEFGDKPVWVAIKSTKGESKFRRAVRYFAREASIWCSLDHANILPFYGLIDEPELGVCMMQQTAEGLRYLHNKSVRHGNARRTFTVKCANILVSDQGQALVCDFMISCVLDVHASSITSQMTKATITQWSAPEILSDTTGATKPSDAYSFAMTVLEAITMTAPFGRMRWLKVLKGVKKGLRPERPVPGSSERVDRWLSDDLWNFMIDCWKQDPYKRPSIKDAVKTLRNLIEREGQ